MLTESQSIYYFLLLCITSRIILCLIPIFVPKNILFYYGFILSIISFIFIYLFITDSRLNAFEAAGKTWWENYRLIHGLLFLCAAIYSINEDTTASLPLCIDVILGLILFINKRFLQ